MLLYMFIHIGRRWRRQSLDYIWWSSMNRSSKNSIPTNPKPPLITWLYIAYCPNYHWLPLPIASTNLHFHGPPLFSSAIAPHLQAPPSSPQNFYISLPSSPAVGIIESRELRQLFLLVFLLSGLGRPTRLRALVWILFFFCTYIHIYYIYISCV